MLNAVPQRVLPPLPALLPPTRHNCLLLLAVVLSLGLGATSIAEAHTGHGLLLGAAYLLVTGVVLGQLLFRSTLRSVAAVLAQPAMWAVLLLIVTAADQFHFRGAEQRSDPLTSSLALELPANALLQGHDPYSVHLFHEAPISPGPGWIVLLAPLTAIHATGLLGMLALAIAAGCLLARSRLAAGVFCLVMLSGPLFQSQAANGQDLFVLTLACVALLLLLERFAHKPPTVVALSVAAGILATARLPFVAILLVPGLGLWRRDRRSGAVYLAVMPLVALLLDGGFAWWAHHSGDRFQPMHIFHRGAAAAGHGAQFAVAVLLLAALWWVVRYMRGRAEDWLLGTWFVVTALFLPEAAKEFNQMHHDLRWEGSTYATFALPLLAAVLSLRVAYPIGNSKNANAQKIEGQAARWNGGE